MFTLFSAVLTLLETFNIQKTTIQKTLRTMGVKLTDCPGKILEIGTSIISVGRMRDSRIFRIFLLPTSRLAQECVLAAFEAAVTKKRK